MPTMSNSRASSNAPRVRQATGTADSRPLVYGFTALFQLADDVRHSVLANAGTLISFRVGADDATVVARFMQPQFAPLDLVNLPNYNFLVRLMIDGAPSIPFSARCWRYVFI